MLKFWARVRARASFRVMDSASFRIRVSVSSWFCVRFSVRAIIWLCLWLHYDIFRFSAGVRLRLWFMLGLKLALHFCVRVRSRLMLVFVSIMLGLCLGF